MSAWRCWLLVGVVCVATASWASAHPIVAGFERFYNTDKSDAVAGGRLLLNELNCVSCHQMEGASKKQAPILDGVTTRVRTGHLKQFLANPHQVKPGTTMPAVFADDPDKDAKVEALVHFLAQTGPLKQTRPDLKAIIRGKDFYAKLGCAACHGSRDLNGEAPKTLFAHAVPMGDVKNKYSIPGLTSFLSNPLAVRPSGRMPHLLKGAEASDVAHYLLQGSKVNLPTGAGTTTYSYFEGDWQKLPDFGKMKPKASGKGIAFELGVAKNESNYGIRFEGYFNAVAAGAYTFHLNSDDGSKLLIDGRVAVDNDGIHAPQSKSGTMELTKGIHKITVDFFQGGGGAELDVEIEGRGLGRQPLAPLVAASEAELDKKPEPKETKDEDNLVVKPELATKGKQIFQAAGCANCHQLKQGNQVLASELKATDYTKLKATGGCLSETPKKGLPAYSLSGSQSKAIVAAMTAKAAVKNDAATKIHNTMTTFNCYACHTRDKVGGANEATNALFQTTTPEMGDEGRLPPPLDGVGAKLQLNYVKQLLDKGADDRPYMHTRMPGFGSNNLGDVAETFDSTDKLPEVAAVKFTDTDAKVKSSGRHMVGAQGFGCIKCHTFAGNKAEGVQGIDMLLMPKRLKRDWFHAYCIDPQKIRPGTRMPTAWPNGQSVLPSQLDGKASTQIEAILVYISANNPAIPAGMGKKFLPLVPFEEAIIYRNFITGAGNRAIGVGYPEKLNLAFDANELRIAMIWKNGFIDAAKHWTDRGQGTEGPLGDDVLPLPAGAPFAKLAKTDLAWPTQSAREMGYRFSGYKLTPDERPTFRYQFNDITIEDFPNPSGKEAPTLKRTFTLTSDKPVEGLYFRAAVGNKIELADKGWHKLDGWRVKVEGAESTIRNSGKKQELVVPVRFKDGKATFTIEIGW